MASQKVIRVTMFKLPQASIETALGLYKTLSGTATKDGKPYILSLAAGPSLEDARNQGYTLVAKSEFANLADMQHYDTECEAHKTLKAGMRQLGSEGVLTVFYSPVVEAGN